ncbi:helix-turn-helix domain-containing protein [Caproiciproducens sp. MSJ-32]|uniref:helix-turn-helix domain-containing protein n=1 Tax=Caproiciproducens sp. MSJ-32 TaxID=2841527 RepID=UPI001C11F78C|nr:helix-turn-helix transcriptional regulator [Caproiciproducens sp. MSJ-32]MBU5455292.1 helix-turn-helix transcriptional regulator [Caproiciproducens sp. MSJ-32]
MDNICKRFGLNVKKFRQAKGYSQEKLAELTGLHRTYISSVERGTRSISLNNIEKIAIALDIQIYELFKF